jgi:hypothetical protein
VTLPETLPLRNSELSSGMKPLGSWKFGPRLGFSVPVQLPFAEEFRLLTFLKVRYRVSGVIQKAQLDDAFKAFGIDRRTGRKYLELLINGDLVGADSCSFFLRPWRFIYKKLGCKHFQCNRKTFKR